MRVRALAVAAPNGSRETDMKEYCRGGWKVIPEPFGFSLEAGPIVSASVLVLVRDRSFERCTLPRHEKRPRQDFGLDIADNFS